MGREIISLEGIYRGCFVTQTAAGVCPLCGYSEALAPSPHVLPPGAILAGRYLVGQVLGEGGFGITYAGLDLNLRTKVALKDYYPTGYVTRENTLAVAPFAGEKGAFFAAGRDKFVEEARNLARYRNIHGIVAVLDFFMENGTAYRWI